MLDDKLTNTYVKMPNVWYDDRRIKNDEITIMLLLYRNYIQYKSVSLCSIGLLLDYMKFSIHNNSEIINNIKDIFNLLIKNKRILGLYDIYYNIISIEDIKDKNYLFYVELTIPPTMNYTQIYDKEMDKIFTYSKGTNLNKSSIIRYFVACRRVINSQSRFGFLTQSKLKILLSDSRTIHKYNKILQDDLHLIRYCNDYITSQKHYCTTFIGYWDEKSNFDNQIKFAVSEQKLIPINKTNANAKRSIKQKIHKIEKDEFANDSELRELEMYRKKYGKL